MLFRSEIKDSMSIILPDNKAFSNITVIDGRISCDKITIYSKKLKDMFPQHDDGPKHLRPIKLESWQQDIVNKFPKDFLRGLIHSDGCRYIAKQDKYQSPRYCFTNVSTDIIELCCSTMNKLGITYSISKKAIKGLMKYHSYNVFVQKKQCVEILDSFIGPKT